MSADVAGGAGPAPAGASSVFGTRLPAARRYAELLAGDGVVRGLLGPREVPRLWDRHLLNSAAVAALVPPDSRVIDVGSGAGLPGIPLALARPDLRVDLVEPMLRRTAFLTEVVRVLGLSGVRVVRGRAPDVVKDVGSADYVTARAVAPLDRLVEWCLPLLDPGGVLLAIKGASASSEVGEHRHAVRQFGAEVVDVRELTVPDAAATWVVVVQQLRQSKRRGR